MAVRVDERACPRPAPAIVRQAGSGHSTGASAMSEMPDRATVVVVHGTFSSRTPVGTPRWYEPGQDFCRGLDAELEARGNGLQDLVIEEIESRHTYRGHVEALHHKFVPPESAWARPKEGAPP